MLYTTLHWRCSPQHNSHLVLPFIRIRHPYISVHFPIFLHYIKLFHKTTGLYIQKNKTLEAPDRWRLLGLSFPNFLYLKRKKTSLPELILLDVKLRTSPLLEMIRTWTWGTAETKAVWDSCFYALPCTCTHATQQFVGVWSLRRNASSPVAVNGIVPVWEACGPSGPRLEPKNWGTFKRINWYNTQNNTAPRTPASLFVSHDELRCDLASSEHRSAGSPKKWAHRPSRRNAK